MTIDDKGKVVIEPPPKDAIELPVPAKDSAIKSDKMELLRRIPQDTGVNAVAFSADGKQFLTNPLFGKGPILRDTQTGQKLQSFEGGHTAEVVSAALSKDGKYVLTGSDDKTAFLWDAHTGEKVRAFEGHAYSVRAVAFSADGKLILTASQGDSRTKPAGIAAVFLWETETGRQVRLFKLSAVPLSVAFRPDGEQVLANTTAGLQFWETATGNPLPGIKPDGRGGLFESAAFSPDGKQVLTSGISRGSNEAENFPPDDVSTAVLWVAGTRKYLRSFKGHTERIGVVAFSPDGKYIVTWSWDKSVIVWDPQTGHQRWSFHLEEARIFALDISREGKLLIGGPKMAALWQLPTEQGK